MNTALVRIDPPARVLSVTTIPPSLSLAEVIEEPSFVARRAARTLKLYRLVLARLAARFGITHVEDVTVPAVRAWVDTRLGEVSAASARIEFTGLGAILTHLERTERLDPERLRRVRRLKPWVRAPQLLSAAWLTREQVDDLCVVAGKGTMTELTVRVAALSGLRAGELARLEWSDVSLEARTIVVRWDPSRGGTIKTSRERVVPIVAELLQVLREHPMARATREAGRGRVLSQRSAGSETLAERLERLCRLPDAPRANLNLLRHTRASWWVQAGVPIAKVAAWMGHSPEVAAGHYIGLTRGYDQDADRGGVSLISPGSARARASIEADHVERGPDGRARLVAGGEVVADLGRALHEAAILEVLLALPGPLDSYQALSAEVERRAGVTLGPRGTVATAYRRLAAKLKGTAFALVPVGRGGPYGFDRGSA